MQLQQTREQAASVNATAATGVVSSLKTSSSATSSVDERLLQVEEQLLHAKDLLRQARAFVDSSSSLARAIDVFLADSKSMALPKADDAIAMLKDVVDLIEVRACVSGAPWCNPHLFARMNRRSSLMQLVCASTKCSCTSRQQPARSPDSLMSLFRFALLLLVTVISAAAFLSPNEIAAFLQTLSLADDASIEHDL